MARFPQFEDYEKRGNFDDGVKRCDELLKKSPKNTSLLITKLRLLAAANSNQTNDVLDEIVAVQPPTENLHELIAIEEAVTVRQSSVYPRLSSISPQVSKLWDNSVKSMSNMNQKLEAISIRFERAILDHRLTDAQQALIQLKAVQPKNRVVYMAHAAFTQLISTSNEDLQARLGIGLARKAVTEKFDQYASLDCRVPGQIFALQGAETDVEGIKGTRFGESKQVFDVLRRKENVSANGSVVPSAPEPASVPANEWLNAEINALKSQFGFLIEANAAVDAVRAFAINAINLFHKSTTTLSSGARRSPADACFLAISALVRMFEQTDDTRYLLHASHLAESLLRCNEHIHEARLILVYLYMRLGLGSLAMKLFDSLSVKEIQHDTVGHVLFTNLSLIHPSTTSWGKTGSMDPLKRLTHALGVYARHEDKLAETQASVLSTGQTGMIFDLQELRDSLRMSLARRITLLEQRRTARLAKDAVATDEAARAMGPMVCENWVLIRDTRDFSAAFDYGYNVEKVLHGRDGILPGKAWVLYSLAADTAWCLASESASLVHDPESILSSLQQIKSDVDVGSDGTGAASALGLTAAECLAGELAFRTLALLLNVQSADASQDKLGDCLASCTEAIKALNIDLLTTTPDPLIEHLQHHYAYIDVFLIALRACKYAHGKPSLADFQPLKGLETLAKQAIAALQKHSTEQQARIKASDVRQQMSQDEEFWKALQDFGAAEELDRFCDEVAKSGKEGWEGVCNVRLV